MTRLRQGRFVVSFIGWMLLAMLVGGLFGWGVAEAVNGLVVGRRLQGKSTLSLVLARTEHPSIVIWDPNCQYRRIPSFERLQDVQRELETPQTLLAFRPSPDALEPDFEALVTVLRDYTDWTLVVDEAHNLQGRGWLHPDLAWLIRQAPIGSGPERVSVIQSTHRLVDLHTDVRALATDSYLFFADLARDLDGIENQYGPEVRSAVSRLPEYHVLHYWLGSGGRRQWRVWDKPQAWYLDIGRR